MTTTYSKNKRFLFPVLAVLFAFAAVAITTENSVQAQEAEESDIDKMYEELDAQYNAILEKYGYVTPELTFEEELRLEAELAPLDEQYWDLEDEFEYYEISPELEAQYEELDKQYNAILEQFGFSFPELTEIQEIELEKKLAPLDKQYEQIFEEFDEESLTEKQEEELDSELEILDSKYSDILGEFGFVEPVLTEEQEIELEQLLEPLERQYELLDSQFNWEDEDDHEDDDD